MPSWSWWTRSIPSQASCLVCFDAWETCSKIVGLIAGLPLSAEGILFSVRPPKKSWKNIANLSGGEKTLSSLSLVFALHHFKPTPLYVMDEIDAALGELCSTADVRCC